MVSPFVQIHGESSSDYPTILAILEKRFPKSCVIYNAVKIAPRFPNHSGIYWVNPSPENNGIGLNEESWIIATHFAEDIGQSIIISSPVRNSQNANYTPQEKATLLQLFSNCPKSILNWDHPHWFVALDVQEARLMTEISVEVKGHSIETHPDTLAYMEKDDLALVNRIDADLQEISRRHPDLEVKPLDSVYGTEFLTKTWKIGSAASAVPIKRYLETNESAGVYRKVNGVDAGVTESWPLSGILLHGFGLLSMLYTSEEVRGQGYAKMGIQYAAKAMLEKGLVPVSSIDNWNTPSLSAHTKLGFKLGGLVQWIMFKPSKELLKLRKG